MERICNPRISDYGINTNYPERGSFQCSAGGGRTHTVLPPTDFKSVASANSATAPYFPYSTLSLHTVKGIALDSGQQAVGSEQCSVVCG